MSYCCIYNNGLYTTILGFNLMDGGSDDASHERKTWARRAHGRRSDGLHAGFPDAFDFDR